MEYDRQSGRALLRNYKGDVYEYFEAAPHLTRVYHGAAELQDAWKTVQPTANKGPRPRLAGRRQEPVGDQGRQAQGGDGSKELDRPLVTVRLVAARLAGLGPKSNAAGGGAEEGRPTEAGEPAGSPCRR